MSMPPLDFRRTHGFSWHQHKNPWDGAPPWAIELREMACLLHDKLEFMMSALDNLTAAEANLETVVAAAIADIQTLAAELATANNTSDPAIQAVVDKMNATVTNLSNVVTPPTPSTTAPPAAPTA